MGLRLLLVAGVWGFLFCCAALGVIHTLGDGGLSMPSNLQI